MNRQPPSPFRPLSTSARVHPPYLPYLHQASRTRAKGLKWTLPLASLVGAGYAVATYRGAQRLAAAQAKAEAEAEAEGRRRREAALADAYGDRGSLEELQRAMRVYEAQARERERERERPGRSQLNG